MEIRFDGKRALVTGAGKGIGRRLVKALVECGAETFALSRTKSDLDSLKEELPTIHTVLVDLSDWAATRKAVQDIGGIDLLVNNAAVLRPASFLDVTPEDMQETYDINVKAVVNVSQVACKGMIERGVGGSVVNISSQVSMVTLENTATYASSKGALDVITKVMAVELGPRKIRVNAVNPTLVWTDFVQNIPPGLVNFDEIIAEIPLKRAAEIEEVVNAVLFLLSDKASMIHGVRLPVDGGRTTV